MQETRTVFKLDDSVIAQIVRILQIGILTGTDVSDHMRELILEPSAGGSSLVLTPEYVNKHQRDLDSMFSHLEKMITESGQTS
jgi:hypothetical protein